MQSFTLSDNKIFIENSLNIKNAEELLDFVNTKTADYKKDKLIIDLSKLDSIDSAGVATIDQIIVDLKKQSIRIEIVNASNSISKSLKTFSSLDIISKISQKEKDLNFLEKLGNSGFIALDNIKQFILLSADIFYWGFLGLFSKKGQRRGEFVLQSNLIGVNALPIVGLISFLVGFILSLQSAQQLRQFGANIFVVDLIAISMLREMGPLMTAIILAGRSGSAIASEIATMKISEEIDALKTMALNPIKYVALPKVYAMIVATPLLTIFSDIIGIAGGFLVGITFLKISPTAFIDRMASVIVFKDIITSMVKSVVFAWLISLVGIYFGLRAKGGAEGVGRATTKSVVTAIFMVIIADSILGLLFY
ncbi:MAG: MlaE family lipid ABC transporter permease subunit [Candidatus Cloacimonetes bacterium]|nr:MlaE family lipid ABC transporter permease subunit [Candidatus Cloacimonadota bacterium]